MNKEIKVGSKVLIKAADGPYGYKKDATGIVLHKYKMENEESVVYSKEWKDYGHNGSATLPSSLYKELITDGKIEKKCLWCVRDDKLELIEERTQINITVDGKSVIAEMDGKEAVAKCHPGDKFNVLTGAVIALHRLLGNEGINRSVISKELNIDTTHRVKKMKMLLNSVFGASLNAPTGTPDVKEETKPVVKAVHREAKFGEYVKVVGINNNFNRGEIVRCVLENNEYHYARFANEFTKFEMLVPYDYVVLENYEAALEWKKNHPKGFKIGDLVVLSKDHEAAFAVLKKGHVMQIDDIKDGKFYLRSASDDIEYRGFTMVVKDSKGVFEKVDESEIKESSGEQDDQSKNDGLNAGNLFAFPMLGFDIFEDIKTFVAKQNECLKKDELAPGDYVVLTEDDSTPSNDLKKGDILKIKEFMGELLDGCKLYYMVRMRDNAEVIMLDKFVRKIKTDRNKYLKKGDKLLVLGDNLLNSIPGDIVTYDKTISEVYPTHMIIAVSKSGNESALGRDDYLAIENYDEIKEFLEGK